MEKLPQIHELILKFSGIDAMTDFVPILPTAHYAMGGIPTDVNGQVVMDAKNTPVTGFYAAGECACVSVHGANRLGCNSTMDCAVFGRRTGRTMVKYINGGAEKADLPKDALERAKAKIDWFLSLNGKGKPGGHPGRTADDHDGQLLDLPGGETPEEAAGDHQIPAGAVQEDLRSATRGSGSTPSFWMSSSWATCWISWRPSWSAALARTESRGAHSRTGFPQTGRCELAETHPGLEDGFRNPSGLQAGGDHQVQARGEEILDPFSSAPPP